MTDWTGKNFLVQGRGGHVYKFVLHITEVDNPPYCHIAAVDMRFVLPENFGGEDEPVGHAMFCEKHDPNKEEIICRNSWGSSYQHLRIPYYADYIFGLYYVRVKDLIWLAGDDTEKDRGIFENY